MKKPFGEEEIKILLDATFRIMGNAKEPNTSPEIKFLNLYIESLITQVFKDNLRSDVSKQEQFRYIKDSFLELKIDIQEAIALGFQSSMEKFSKVPVEYYCTVKPVAKVNSDKSH